MELLSIAKDAKLVGFDVDEKMMDKAKIQIGTRDEELGTRIEYVHGNYADIVSVLDGRKADYILNDLGVNLEHFKDVERGFSIRGEAALDMRFDTSKGMSAADLVRTYSIDQLKNIFEIYADFSSPKALELAKHIVTTRKQKPIKTTQDLKLVLNACGLGDKACTVIFQAIRIEVNSELDNLKRFLSEFPETLNLT
jgi:16S rRNA (cytosine1402-N4)-methyltransferase